MNLKMKLSNNFTLQEFVKSQVAERLGIDNTPTKEHVYNATILCKNVLQPVREHFGPTVINSGYRGTTLNTTIGGSTNSQHTRGEAADIEVPGVSNLDLALWIEENLEFDQLILEFWNPDIPDSGWVHVSYTPSKENRKQTLTALRQNGETKYLPGLYQG